MNKREAEELNFRNNAFINLCNRIQQAQNNYVNINTGDFDTLRRASMTLRRWFERECGDGYGRCIERDDETGIAYETYELPIGRNTHGRGRRKIADRETGARRRIAAICARLGLYYYIQTDCRGCALYVSDQPLTSSDYTKGVAIY